MYRLTLTSVFALAVPTFLLVCGCSDSEPTSPPIVSPVQVTLAISSLEGDPDHPITMTAQAWRSAKDSIRYYKDCCSPAVWIEMTDPAGNMVTAEQYRGCECPSVPYDLDAEGVTTTQVFDGMVWVNGWVEREALQGHYLVTARFTYHHGTPLDGRPTTITITKSFMWDDSSP